MSETEDIPSPDVVVTERKAGVWSRWGGGSLMFAAALHLIALGIGAFWIFQIIHEPEKKVDFMPAGSAGGGPRGAEQQVQSKKQQQITPQTNVKRVFAEGAIATYAIPDPGQEFGQMSALSSLGGGGMGGGLGGSGSGKGFGSGVGTGTGQGGNPMKGIKLFGMDLQVKSIGVVLDVSRSMTPLLEKVVNEINVVAEGSPIVLHVGCGVGEIKGRPEDKIMPVSAPRDAFKKFWYLHQDPNMRNIPAGSDASDTETTGPIPQQTVYDMLFERKKTYFHDRGKTQATGVALTADEFRTVEAIYWFADFQDPIDPKMAEEIRKVLIRRKQKLYIHAFKEGKFFQVALDELVQPTGGKKITKE